MTEDVIPATISRDLALELLYMTGLKVETEELTLTGVADQDVENGRWRSRFWRIVEIRHKERGWTVYGAFEHLEVADTLLSESDEFGDEGLLDIQFFRVYPVPVTIIDWRRAENLDHSGVSKEEEN